MASDSSKGPQGARATREMHGVQPVLDAIKVLETELRPFDDESEAFKAERTRLLTVLLAVRDILVAQCPKSDLLPTYYAWMLEGIE